MGGPPARWTAHLKPVTHPSEITLIRNLLARFNPWGDQSDVIYARLMAKIDNLGNLAEVQVFVTLHKHHLLLPRSEDLSQLWLKIRLREGRLVDQVRRRAC